MSGQKGQPGQGTRKPLFKADEKVLCYEPDQKKAQVLYDSKVLKVVEKKDGPGKFHFEYKIHFQGWKSSWDRHVREENVLKDTDKNRKLQRQLNEQAQLLNKNSLKKKKKKTLQEKLKQASQNAKDAQSKSGKGKHSRTRDDARHQTSGSERDTSDQESSDDDDGKGVMEIELPTELINVLNEDYLNVRTGNKLVTLPAEVTVVELLEGYVNHVGRTEITSWMDWKDKNMPSGNASSGALSGKLSSGKGKATNTTRSKADVVNEELIKTFQRINFVKKIVEDVRIMFDFMLAHILLYDAENNQHDEFMESKYFRPQRREYTPDSYEDEPEEQRETNSASSHSPAQEPPTKRRKTEPGMDGVTFLIPLPPVNGPSTSKAARFQPPPIPVVVKQGRVPCELGSECEYPWACEQLNNFMDDMVRFRLLPEELGECTGYPSLSYGVVHLLRLFVKMPDILSRSSISRKKLRTIVGHINKIILYINGRTELFTVSNWYVRENVDQENSVEQKPSRNLPRKARSLPPQKPRPASLREAVLRKSAVVAARNLQQMKTVKTETATATSSRRKTIATETVTAPPPPVVIKVEKPDKDEEFKRPAPVKRSRRLTTGRMTDSPAAAGSAVGTRKSAITQDLIKKEPQATPNKQYSLRAHCRAPYK